MSTRTKRGACITAAGALLIFLLVCAGCQVSLNLFYTHDPVAVQSEEAIETEAEVVA